MVATSRLGQGCCRLSHPGGYLTRADRRFSADWEPLDVGANPAQIHPICSPAASCCSVRVPAFGDSCAPYTTMALPWSGCPDLKVYRDLLVCSLERQLDGTGKRVQARQELQYGLSSRWEAFPGGLFGAV
jgi:hypothetical protein